MSESKLSEFDVVTGPARISFPSLFTATPISRTRPDDLKYQAVLLLPPDFDLEPLKKAAVAAMVDKWGKTIKLSPRNNPFKKCEDKTSEKPIEGYEEGWLYVKVSSKFPPAVVDQKTVPIKDESQVYPGCWCRFYVTAYAWEHAEGGKGVSFSLNAVQKVRDDERLGDRPAATDVFAPVDTDDGGVFDEATAAVVEDDDIF